MKLINAPEEDYILALLEESEREAQKGVWLSHEEVFFKLHERLDELIANEQAQDTVEVQTDAI